jgi:hypothetical protein
MEYQADTEPCLPGWEVSIYNVYIINQFKPLLLGGGGGGNKLVMVTVNSKEENSLKGFVPITSKNSASGRNRSM